MVEIEEHEISRETKAYKDGIALGIRLCVDSILGNLDGFGEIVFGIPDYSRVILEQVENRCKEGKKNDAAGNKAKNIIAD